MFWNVNVHADIHSGLHTSIHILPSTVVSRKGTHGRSILQVCQRGGWVFLRVFPHLTTKEHLSCLQWLDALEAKNWTNNNGQRNHQWASKSSPDGTQHAEWHHVTVSIVYLVVRTVLAMSVYAKMPCSNLWWSITWSFLPQISIALETVLSKLRVKLAPGWVLIRVN